MNYPTWRTTMCTPFLICAAASAAPGQTFTSLASFNGTNGSFDLLSGLGALLVQGVDGSIYGTAPGGGTGTSCSPSGCGVVFKITQAGITAIYNFCTAGGYPDCPDGYGPSNLMLAENGVLFGTTQGGVNGTGTVFQITSAGKLTTYNLCESDCFYSPLGSGPTSLMQVNSGTFYGTTSGGGLNGLGGAVFKMSPSGVFSPFYSFCSLANCADGKSPYAGLVAGAAGKFYGNTYADGAYGGGTLFEITSGGVLTTLHNFGAAVSGGWEPYGRMLLATDGNLYGTTETEGANDGGGTIYRFSSAGFTTLYSFCAQSDCTDGGGPYSGLMQDTNGSFYGITSQGGASDQGAVYKLSVGLGPFVKILPTSEQAGKNVRILGTSLMGASSVTFNGMSAAFTVESAGEIIATVPAAATTGKVQVTTPGGTLTSNVAFVVQ